MSRHFTENIDMVISAFESEVPLSQVFAIEGVNGSDKMAFLTSVTNELGKSKDWIMIDLNSNRNLIDDFAARLVDSCKEIHGFCDQRFGSDA